MACSLKNGLNDDASTASNFAGKRKKRSTTSSTNSSSSLEQTKSSSNSSTKSISSIKFTYGCPPDFEKVSEYLCLHLGRNSTGHAKAQTFLQSEFYCKSKGNGASLVFIENLEDARTLSKWIGNIFHAVINHQTLTNIVTLTIV